MEKQFTAFKLEAEVPINSDKSARATRRHFIDSFVLRDPLSKIPQKDVIEICDARITTHRNSCDWEYTRQTLKTLLQKIPTNPEPKKILDFGCGDAPIIDVLETTPELLTEADIYGVDISQTAIQGARDRTGTDGRFHFQCIRNLKLLPDYKDFDAGVANFVMHFKVTDRYIEWVSNSLKKDGVFVFNYYKAKSCIKHYNCVKKHFEKVGFELVDEFEIKLPHHDGQVKSQKAVVYRKI